MTLTHIAERGAVTICFYALILSPLGFEHLTFRFRDEQPSGLFKRRATPISKRR